jgi:hypothetical protein
LIGLLTFVIYRLMPTHAIDPWHLLEPREAWAIVVVIAGLGFFNYIMLRLFGTRGVYYAAFLGGLVNSTAAAAELSGAFSTLEDEAIPPAALLLTSAAMFIRNLAILAIFATPAVPGALPALGGMALVTIPFVWWGWRTDKLIGGSPRLAAVVGARIKIRSAVCAHVRRWRSEPALFGQCWIPGLQPSRRSRQQRQHDRNCCCSYRKWNCVTTGRSGCGRHRLNRERLDHFPSGLSAQSENGIRWTGRSFRADDSDRISSPGFDGWH